MTLEMQPLTQPTKLFGYILSIARLGSIQDQDASLLVRHGDKGDSELRLAARRFHDLYCLLSVREV
jgi:hypothetical protein